MPRSPGYSPPTLGGMKTVVKRTLRDEQGVVFSDAMLGDFITEGLASLSAYRPIEAIESIAYAPTIYGEIQTVMPTILSNVWQVTARNPEDPTNVAQSLVVPYNTNEGDIQNGWDFYGGTIYLGRWVSGVLDQWVGHTAGSLDLTLSGYRDRSFPTSDPDILDLEDPTDYLCLVKECRALGFQSLNNDRALYQQWLASTNNTDVSPTQLAGMLNSAQGDVDRARKRSAILRRQPVVGPQYP